jgi:hypothetical protein
MGFTDLSKKKTATGGSTVVTVDSPVSTFGEVLTATLTPVAQGDFVFNVNDQIFNDRQFAGGTLTVSDGMAVLDSGTDPSGSAVVQLRRGLKYKPGQGSLMRATALFSTPNSGNAQFIGMGSAECGYFIGYFGTNFGILHSEDGQREIRKLTVTTGAGTGNCTVTLDGDSISVPITGGSSPEQTAYQLSIQDYSNVGNGGWLADAVSGSVYFVSARADSMGGSYSVSGNGIVGTFTQTKAGIAQTNTFIASGSFNVDNLDGTGPSRMTLNPQRGNVFQIGFQYLGFGNSKFYVEDPETGRPYQFHEIKNANSRTTPVLKNPNVSVLATSANIGGTTPTQLKTVSMAGYVEGDQYKLDPKFSYSNTFSNINESSYVPFIMLKSNRVFHDDSCYGEFDILKVAASNEVNNKTLTVGLFLTKEVTGEVDFQYIDEDNSIVAYADLDPSNQEIINPGRPFYEIVVGSASSQTVDLQSLNFIFGPGDCLLIAIKTTALMNGSVSVNWYEQQ